MHTRTHTHIYTHTFAHVLLIYRNCNFRPSKQPVTDVKQKLKFPLVEASASMI